VANGLPPQPGAPYADPCIDDSGNAKGSPRSYKAANIQLDVKLNKAGWHFKQQRILALWGDVSATLNSTRPPEPLFFRANTNDCITYYHANLVPNVYEQDDFQVRTPTDILGQHIHLVKFDVTSSDGSGNGWNYEDGTFSPDEVIERIHAINALGGLIPVGGGTRVPLTERPHPFFGTPGAQTTVQRWFADDVLNNAGKDRTLRTVFTHDHYGPSTHQQVGLYAGLVIEPFGSTWRHSETGAIFGTRFDGGPTSWRADILTSNSADSFREFLLEFADMQHAYTADNVPVNPPGRVEVGLPFLLEPPVQCPGGVPAPCPEAITADDPGTFAVNYRNEPIPLRIRNPLTNTQAAGDAGDLSKVYLSTIQRADAAFNVQPNFYPPLTAGVQPKDPFTPLLRAYAKDKVQIRILVGAHEEGHNLGVQGLKWLFEPSFTNSGYRNNQMAGISEHFEVVTPLPIQNPFVPFVDYLYEPGTATDDQWNGLWGILRAYNARRADLLPLPSNPTGGEDDIKSLSNAVTAAEAAQPLAAEATATVQAEASAVDASATTSLLGFGGFNLFGCTVRLWDVTAVSAQLALPGGTLVYNPRTNQGGQLHDPTAILYVRTSDLNTSGQLIAGRPIEPLVIRARAGECIKLVLRNRLPVNLPDLDGFNTLPMIVNRFNNNQIRPSNLAGLRPQLVFHDVSRSAGVNVGFNPIQTVAPGQSRATTHYSGCGTLTD
jgi:hypothetical protein